MSDGIVVIEAEHFATEQAALMVDPIIVDMAGGLVHDENAPKGDSLLEWLDSHHGMTTAMRVAQDRGVKFQSIGGPARAIRALVAAHLEAEASK